MSPCLLLVVCMCGCICVCVCVCGCVCIKPVGLIWGRGQRSEFSRTKTREIENGRRKREERKDEEGRRVRGQREKQDKVYNVCRGSCLWLFLLIFVHLLFLWQYCLLDFMILVYMFLSFPFACAYSWYRGFALVIQITETI